MSAARRHKTPNHQRTPYPDLYFPGRCPGLSCCAPGGAVGSDLSALCGSLRTAKSWCSSLELRHPRSFPGIAQNGCLNRLSSDGWPRLLVNLGRRSRQEGAPVTVFGQRGVSPLWGKTHMLDTQTPTLLSRHREKCLFESRTLRRLTPPARLTYLDREEWVSESPCPKNGCLNCLSPT